MIQIKIVKHKKAIPLNDIGDILRPFETWENTLTGGGWYSKITDEFYKDKPYYPLKAVDQNPWSALKKLGVDHKDFFEKVKYTCPYNNYVHYWGVPVIIFTDDVKTWTARHKVHKEEMYLNKEWMRNFFPPKVKDSLPFTKIQRALLGPGYTNMTIATDGSGYLYDGLVAIDNGDFLGVKVWIWFNK